MKFVWTLLALSFVGLLCAENAVAFPGQICTSSDFCSRCEVCVIDNPPALGHCHKIAGCY